MKYPRCNQIRVQAGPNKDVVIALVMEAPMEEYNLWTGKIGWPVGEKYFARAIGQSGWAVRVRPVEAPGWAIHINFEKNTFRLGLVLYECETGL